VCWSKIYLSFLANYALKSLLLGNKPPSPNDKNQGLAVSQGNTLRDSRLAISILRYPKASN